MAKNRIYVGYITAFNLEVFRSDKEPTRQTHGDKYMASMGPFRTMRAARFMRDCGVGNPHCITVGDAERIAKAKGYHTKEGR